MRFSSINVQIGLTVTDNPQTFNEALLLMANLARFTPDSVLHNIMPIFTFMGSNVFHRDDSYSFKVVQNVSLGPFVTGRQTQGSGKDHQQHCACDGVVP